MKLISKILQNAKINALILNSEKSIQPTAAPISNTIAVTAGKIKIEVRYHFMLPLRFGFKPRLAGSPLKTG